MKKLLYILLCLYSFNAKAIDADELIKIEKNTDKFFELCTNNKNQDVMTMSYCIGFYKGLAIGWQVLRFTQEKCSGGIPPFNDFSTKFNSLFYRNQIDTSLSTGVNIYMTLDELCEK